MSLSSSSNKALFNGNGSAGPFTFNFKFFSNADIKVYKADSAGTVTTLTEGSQYTLTGAGLDAGGSVTLFTALAVGESLCIYRLMELTQTTSLPDNGPFFATTHERTFDRLTMEVQQVSELANRSLRFSPFSTYDGTLDLGLSDRASKLLGFDINGNAALIDSAYTVTVTAGAAGSVTVTYADASSGPVNVNLPASGEVIVVKTDDTANPVTVTATGGKTILRQASVELTVQDESIRTIMNGTNWYRI